MKKNQAMMISFLSVSAFLLAFLVSNRLWLRLDLTSDKAYTISQVSRDLGKEIMDQVTITYFVSDRLSLAYPLPGEISDLLTEYAAHARGKIRFIIKDPAKSGLQSRVEELGIMPQQIQVAEKNETTVAIVYSGILIEYLDREEVIPVVFSLETLEYDLSTRIRSLIRNRERELGVIVGDANKDWINEYALLNRELVLSGFKVRQINPNDEISIILSALFVMGGADDLDEYTLYKIDRYIREGGNVFFAVKGVFVDIQGGLAARNIVDKGLLAMLAHYGVVVRQAIVMDAAALNLTFQMQRGNGTVIQTVRYPPWISVQGQAGNSRHPLTARFGGLDLFWASPLELNPPAGVNGEILFNSTDRAWLQTGDFNINPNLVSQFRNEENETRGTKIMGVSLSGIFPGFFGGISPGNAVSETLGMKTSRIVVVGDADFAGQLMQVNQSERRNLDFLLRAAEWLSCDDDMLAIRNRDGTASRLDRIIDSEKRNAVMAFSRGINTIVIPLAVILAGIFICKRRTSRNKGYSGDI